MARKVTSLVEKMEKKRRKDIALMGADFINLASFNLLSLISSQYRDTPIEDIVDPFGDCEAARKFNDSCNTLVTIVTNITGVNDEILKVLDKEKAKRGRGIVSKWEPEFAQ